MSLSSVSDRTGASGGGADLGGGAQGQPPYKSESTRLQQTLKHIRNNIIVIFESPGRTSLSWAVEGLLHPCWNKK